MSDLSRGEVVFLLIVVVLIFGWAWFPRAGERLGGLFDRGR